MRTLSLALSAATLTLPALPSAAIANDRDTYQGRTWQDDQGRTRCLRSDGTTGLITGGGAGALIGRTLDTRDERTSGTLIAAAAGALLGRRIQRNRVRCR